MANRKFTIVKIKLIALPLLMCIVAGKANALGVGTLEVLSNLEQPFNGVLELRIAPGDDVDSVTATIAPQEDFNSFNIDYPSYLQDMTVSLDRSGAEPTLRITSNGVIINEPFIHFLIRVDWSGGSFLREYTALIDPPVYAAETPAALSEPTIVGTDQLNQNDSSSNSVVSPQVIPQQETSIVQPGRATDAQYGPVARGESLSVIAQELQQQFPDLSIYQIMQVLFEENRSSFIDQNINGLLAGEVLNIADLNAISSVGVAESLDFFRDQMVQWNPSNLVSDTGDTVRVGQDEYVDSNDDLFGGDFDSVGTGETEQTDTFQVGSSSDTQSFVSDGQGDNQQGEVIALQQEVIDLEASLSSSVLENQELRERISILEGQLADVNRLLSLDVEDSDLANLEATLAEQNNRDDLVNPLEDISGNEEVDLTQPIAELDDFSEIEDTEVEEVAEIEEVEEVEEIEEIEEIEEVKEASPAVVTLSSQPSFFDSGLGKILPWLGGLLLAGLALFFVRRRRADEEFEVSMMTIESHNSNRVDTSSGTVTESPEPEGLAEETEVQVDGGEKDETSFLTVYSDSDAVVQADEVDPVAEADVYIAYGRDEQAEAVLLDGIASKPERIDIKHKLLSLYHKNTNKQAFERVAEELYAQKDQVDAEAWQEISVMGKELLPNNPMFELSASELFVQNELSSSLMDQEEESSIEEDDAANIIAADENEALDSIDFESSLDDADVSLDIEDSINVEGSINVEDSFNVEDDLVGDDVDLLPKGDDLVETIEDESSIQLVNFEEEVSELDDVNIASLDISNEDLIDGDSPKIEEAKESEGDDLVHEVSDLEVDDDYDEARTQYELAKVFVDLGDEEGARKILNEILGDKDNGSDVLTDAKQLLETMDS